jgi:prephenate dehydratase
MNILIIGGRGSMGRLFEKIFISKGHEVKILGRKNYFELNEFVNWSEVIIVSVPLDVVSKVLSDLQSVISTEKIVVDFSSVMSCHFNIINKLNCNSAFIHPLFGPDINSLKNLNMVFVPINGNVDKFINLLDEEDASIIKSTIEEHDKIMGLVQGLTHFNNIVFTKTLVDIGVPDSRFYTTLFGMNKKVIDRMFSQLSHVAANIQFFNKNVPEVIDIHKKNFENIYSIVKNKDLNKFSEILNNISSNITIKKKDNEVKVKKRVWDKDKIAVLGPRGSFTDIASDFICSDKVYFETIPEIIKMLNKGKVKLAVIPIENSIHGTVIETLDGINYFDLHIIKSITLPIHHCFAVLPNNTSIDKILSHSQALMQCSDFIEHNYPNANLINTLSTSDAFQELKEKQLVNSAAIGPVKAAKIYGLDILNENIENEKMNKTKFVVLSRNIINPPNKDAIKTSLVIIPFNERQGLLFNLLKFFADEKINLTKIESRPLRNELGKYIFYIDIDGNINSENVKRAFKNINDNIGNIKILGCYEEIEK